MIGVAGKCRVVAALYRERKFLGNVTNFSGAYHREETKDIGIKRKLSETDAHSANTDWPKRASFYKLEHAHSFKNTMLNNNDLK